jgi:hypothetical protein
MVEFGLGFTVRAISGCGTACGTRSAIMSPTARFIVAVKEKRTAHMSPARTWEGGVVV